MKLAIWLGFACFSLMWTGFIWFAAGLTRWVGEAFESGAAVDWAAAAGAVRFPAWLTWWIDPSFITSIIDAVVRTLEAANQAMPWFNTVAGWVVALLWLLWFAGALSLLLVAGVLHGLASRSAHKPPANSAG